MSENDNNPRDDDASFPMISFPYSPDESGKHIGPYTLIRKLGEGGWGIVYLAEQKLTQKIHSVNIVDIKFKFLTYFFN